MSTFTIAGPGEPAHSIEQGAHGSRTFTVTNGSDSFRNLAVRVAILGTDGEVADAPQATWFEARVAGETFVPAGGDATVEVSVKPPLAADPGAVSWRLVAFDSDLADEDVTEGPLQTLTVTAKPVEDEPAPVIPFWVWIVVGVGALGLIIGVVVAIVNSDRGEPVAEETPTEELITPPPKETGDARRLPVLFKAFQGKDPLAGALGGVVIKVESPLAPTHTVRTNADGEGSATLCVVSQASTSVGDDCVKVLDTLTMRATRNGYKDTPTTTLTVDDLVEAPKTYVQMIAAASEEKPRRPIVVPAKQDDVKSIRDYLDSRGKELEVSGGRVTLERLSTGKDLQLPRGTLHITGVPRDQVELVARLLMKYGDVTDAQAMKLARAAATGEVLAVPGVPADRVKEFAAKLESMGVQTSIR